jgi:hypothetical protein
VCGWNCTRPLSQASDLPMPLTESTGSAS